MRCAIYCRISREDAEGEENASIANQRAILRDHAAKMGWQVTAEYTDEDMSGADSCRPAFNALLQAAKAGEVDVILCKSQSRFTRDMEMVERYLHGLLPRWGVRFVSLADNSDTARRENKKARQINGLVNEWYLEDLSDSIRLVLDHKRREGCFIGSFAPYGYLRSGQVRGLLVPDEAAAETVRRIFTMAAEGQSMQRIADGLNGEGVPNPTAYKRLRGLKYRNEPRGSGDKWSRATVRRIVTNEVYIGTAVQGKRRKEGYKSRRVIDLPPEAWIRVENAHAPLVSRGLFQAANDALRSRSMGRGAVNVGDAQPGQTDAVQ